MFRLLYLRKKGFGAHHTGGLAHRRTRLDEGKNFLILPEMAHDSSVA